MILLLCRRRHAALHMMPFACLPPSLENNIHVYACCRALFLLLFHALRLCYAAVMLILPMADYT